MRFVENSFREAGPLPLTAALKLREAWVSIASKFLSPHASSKFRRAGREPAPLVSCSQSFLRSPWAAVDALAGLRLTSGADEGVRYKNLRNRTLGGQPE